MRKIPSILNISALTEKIISRISGRSAKKINNRIQHIKLSLKIIETIKPSYNNPWLTWYEDYLKETLKLWKIVQFIPACFIPGFILRKNPEADAAINAINKIIKNDKVICKDIMLPFQEDVKDNIFWFIVDILFAYLLDDLDQETLNSIYLNFYEGLYEYQTVRLEKGDIVIDAGANIGAFSALASAKGCFAYAFEPIPDIINTYLSKTAEWNPNITICKYALSDKPGELTFNEDLSNIGGSSLVVEGKNSKKIKAQAIDLDTFAEENKLPKVDFIKADIEGAERYMLMGAKRVLKEFAPKMAICTYHLPDDPQVLRELILDANPNYVIVERWKKMYAYVPKKVDEKS